MRNPVKFSARFFFFLPTFFLVRDFSMAQTRSGLFDVGLVLDLESGLGKMSESCISMALSDLSENQNHSTRLVIHTRDSTKDILGATSAALDLLQNIQVKAIIWTETVEASFLEYLADTAHVPIISFSANSLSLPSVRTPYFIRTIQSDAAQVRAISAIVRAFGWRQLVPVCEDTDYGTRIIPDLTDALREIGVKVPYRSVISPSATDDQMEKDLEKIMSMQTRVFVVHMSMPLGARLFSKAKKLGMMNQGYVWIATSGITDFLDTVSSDVIEAMQGVVGVKPHIPTSRELELFTKRWKQKMEKENPELRNLELSVSGLLAYDTVWALAEAVNRINGSTDYGIYNMKTGDDSTCFASVGVSQIGPRFLEAILTTRFQGLSGEFHLVNGQLQSSVFQIINVFDNSRREIGLWTPRSGMSRTWNLTKRDSYSASRDDLKAVIWPGESTQVPRGWEVPKNGGMKVGVPVKEGFTDFVKVEKDLANNATKVTGFTIDVFNAVLEELPYPFPHNFVPFEGPDGKSAGSYNDLIYQVYLQKYDLVIGDVTVTYNRSLYVDFTLPYTESGRVSMIVGLKDDGRRNLWSLLLEPLPKNVWLMSGAVGLFTGSVLWVLEQRVNEDFRGPFLQRLGMLLYFFYSLIIAKDRRAVTALARFVVIVWGFVMMILKIIYMEGLINLIRMQHLRPSFTNLGELIKSGEYVGVQYGSYIAGFLKEWKFDEAKLKVLYSADEYAEALSKGSRNGGVAAIIGDTLYIRAFLSKYCNRYMAVGLANRTYGFGFAFPKESPLVSDFSRAILKVKERMQEIEEAWLGPHDACEITATPYDGLDNVWSLLAFVGTVPAFVLLILLLSAAYSNRQAIATKVHQILLHFSKQPQEKELPFPATGIEENVYPEAMEQREHMNAGSNTVIQSSTRRRSARLAEKKNKEASYRRYH